ncbi:hypothetical protein GF326_02885 [Candidatus Bathyarchaeota archaeon]|nr:hypothetical protein [Candidatus Bathyarchaeota archaeon]
MKTDAILRKLRRENTEFTTSEELKKLCSNLGIEYDSAIRHLVPRGHLVKVFRGIFYVKSLEEVHLGRNKYSHMELVARGLAVRGVKNWYYGLSTALVLNNMTHERFNVDYVINDNIQRNSSMSIAGHEFIFKKVKPQLLTFGVIKAKLSYSDPEKTILDMVYLDRYGGVPPEKTVLNISEYMDMVDSERLIDYSIHYPLTVGRFVEEMLDEL